MNCKKCKAYMTKEEEEKYKNLCVLCYRKSNGLCVKCGKPLSIFHLENGYEKCANCYKKEKELQDKK